MRSPDGQFELVNDPSTGTLRLENRPDRCVVWAEPESGVAGSVAEMSTDGEFGLVAPDGGVLWDSSTPTHPGRLAGP